MLPDTINDNGFMANTNDQLIAYDSLVNALPVILWEAEPDGLRYRYVSPAAERLLGYPCERWTSEPAFWLEHLHEEDREWVPAHCERAAEQGEYTLSYRMVAADGRVVWLCDQVTVIVEAGRPIRRVGVTVDVTNEQEEAARLRSRERHLELMLDSTSEPICSISADNRCNYCNLAAVRELGFVSRDDIIGQEMHALVHHTRPDGTPYPVEECPLPRAATTPEGIYVDSGWFIRADGSFFPVSCSSNPMVGEDGAVEGCVMAFRDISEERRVRTELRRAATVFEYAAEGIFIVTAELEAIAVNRAYTRMTGYALSDLANAPPPPLGEAASENDLDRDRFECEVRPVLLREGLWEGEVWGRRSDGELHPFWLSLNPVRDDDGVPSQYIGLLSDIAELKQRQARLHHLAHHDALTGLPNRLLFYDRLEQALARARRTGDIVALGFMDIDRFKPINDVYGHAAGDEILIELGRRIQPVLRARDTLGRIGGDEFVILFEDVRPESGAAAAMEKILAQVSREPFHAGGADHQVALSVGIAEFPHDADEGNALLRCADSAMYRAKRAQGTSVAFYSR